MIHMTATVRATADTFIAVCRCPWQEGPFDRREDARAAGDAHLAEANAPEEKNP